MNEAQFIVEVYEIAEQFNPDINHTTPYKEVVKELKAIKDKAMRWEIIVSSFKPEPELFPLKDRRQGQL